MSHASWTRVGDRHRLFLIVRAGEGGYRARFNLECYSSAVSLLSSHPSSLSFQHHNYCNAPRTSGAIP